MKKNGIQMLKKIESLEEESEEESEENNTGSELSEEDYLTE